MTGNLAELWGEYDALIRFWQERGDEAPEDECDRATGRKLALAEQMKAIEPSNLGEVAIQAKLLADLLRDALEPERSLAASIAKQLSALASASAVEAGPLSATF